MTGSHYRSGPPAASSAMQAELRGEFANLLKNHTESVTKECQARQAKIDDAIAILEARVRTLCAGQRQQQQQQHSVAIGSTATVGSHAWPPAGVMGLGCTMLMVGWISMIKSDTAFIQGATSSALLLGGTTQLLAGIWEAYRNHTFPATTFLSYGSLWLGLGTPAIVVLVQPELTAALQALSSRQRRSSCSRVPGRQVSRPCTVSGRSSRSVCSSQVFACRVHCRSSSP